MLRLRKKILWIGAVNDDMNSQVIKRIRSKIHLCEFKYVSTAFRIVTVGDLKTVYYLLLS